MTLQPTAAVLDDLDLTDAERAAFVAELERHLWSHTATRKCLCGWNGSGPTVLDDWLNHVTTEVFASVMTAGRDARLKRAVWATAYAAGVDDERNSQEFTGGLVAANRVNPYDPL